MGEPIQPEQDFNNVLTAAGDSRSGSAVHTPW